MGGRPFGACPTDGRKLAPCVAPRKHRCEEVLGYTALARVHVCVLYIPGRYIRAAGPGSAGYST